MEKRALLAVTLSLAVLYIWNILFPPPKPKLAPAPVVVEKIDAPKAQEVVSPTTNVEAGPSPALTAERLHTITRPEATFIFSNIGGTLKQIEFPDHKDKFPLTRLALLEKYGNHPFVLDSSTETYVRYSLSTPEASVRKEYQFENGLLEARIYVQSKMSRVDKYNLILIDLNTANLSSTATASAERSLYEYAIFTSSGAHRKGDAVHFSPKENKQIAESADIMSYRDHFYMVAVRPQFSTQSYEVNFPDKNSGNFTVVAPVDDKIEQVYKFTIYAGKQDIEALKILGQGFDKIVSFSNFGLFDGIAKFLYYSLIFVHKFVPNWGWCIIIIGFLVYYSVYPLTMRGMASMRRMQLLQPEMATLREKYKNNPQKLNKEVMDLYKKHNVNPLSGCLTFLLQMPIFIGIYQVLWRAPFFKGADFMWIDDLSKPDRLFLFPQTLPFIGNEFNLLPIVMAVIMFVQQKITMKATPVVDPTQAAQQKMMLIFFPVFLGFIFYKFASGLVLYFTIFYALSAITQVKMSKLKA